MSDTGSFHFSRLAAPASEKNVFTSLARASTRSPVAVRHRSDPPTIVAVGSGQFAPRARPTAIICMGTVPVGVSERTRSWDFGRLFSRCGDSHAEKKQSPHSPHATECGDCFATCARCSIQENISPQTIRHVCDTDDKQMLKVVGRSGASATRGGAAMMPELESVPLGQRHSSQRLRRPAARCRRSGGGLRMRPGFVTGGIGTNPHRRHSD